MSTHDVGLAGITNVFLAGIDPLGDSKNNFGSHKFGADEVQS